MKKCMIVTLMICLLIFTGCEKDLTEQVKQNETKVKVGSSVNLKDLFTCEEGVSIGFKNANTFNPNKIGSYSLDATITDGSKQAEKTYIVEVYDDEAPKITVDKEKMVIYENDTFDPKKFVSCTDNSGETIDVKIDDSAVDASKAGEYTVKYSGTDSSGNKADTSATVTVKKAFTYKTLKSLADKIKKDNNYTNLKVTGYKNEKSVSVSFKKIFSPDTKQEYWYNDNIYLSLGAKDKKIIPQIFVLVSEIDSSKYLVPSSMEIESNSDMIKSDKTQVTYDADITSSYAYESSILYFFNQLESLEKFCNVTKGEDITLTAYTDKRTLKHTCSKSEEKSMRQLGEFYAKLLEYM